MIFLRHPRPGVEPGICYGRLDLDIHEEGHGQIERAVELAPPARLLLASPALRCRRLAEAIAFRHGLEIRFDERLWEMNMGDWEGLPWKDIPRHLSEPWLKDPFNLACPNGESFKEVQHRVTQALENHGEDTLVICHAGPIRAVQMAWTGLTFADAFASTPPYAEPIEIIRQQE
ncbi:MAG TPA: histidine phosphatase family protein [Rhizobiaceae bacterium]|nr:histidine phosphatase family protein [Rhizobiaceae bacterium]